MSKFFRCPQALFSISPITGPKAQPPDSEDMRKRRQPAFGHAQSQKQRKKLQVGWQSVCCWAAKWSALEKNVGQAGPKFDFSTLRITGRRAKSVACRSVLVGGLWR